MDPVEGDLGLPVAERLDGRADPGLGDVLGKGDVRDVLVRVGAGEGGSRRYMSLLWAALAATLAWAALYVLLFRGNEG